MKMLKCDVCGRLEELKKDCSTTFLFRDFKDIKLDLCISCENSLENLISDFIDNKKAKANIKGKEDE